ncbi:MAG TPA: tRNA preQ1(34) S-adenosylmethionine ribosyltransferase-isomerase QueA [Nitrospiria bacterium]|nr:tRNA preQ1(34) S-adenosylmethionine ribosyltransferase-isomerase QueA [Nitrospiria bacterium]
MLLSDFDYAFDSALIAQRPSPIRDHSKLLLYKRSDEKVIHTRFDSLPSYLSPGDLLVLNDSKVVPARLRGRKKTGGKVELLLVREREPFVWEALVGGSTREGTRILLSDGGEAEVVSSIGREARLIRFSETGDMLSWLERHGEIPLPPYIRREEGPDSEDRERYQTVFAKPPGSVAAPTAGLHFTHSLLDSLRAAGIGIVTLTLHVGLGTFLPIRSETISDHSMYAERYLIPPETISAILGGKSNGKKIVAVGTTTVRALESAFDRGRPVLPSGETSLFIRPGHRFGIVDGLITNFHLPRSTLLLLVAAFTGREKLLSLYKEALLRRYRFYSFGDAMCIL